MSEITDRIVAFNASGTDWVGLRDWLAHRRYPAPPRLLHGADPMLEDDDEFPTTADGTWDEVRWAAYRGLLTADQYRQVVAEADAWRRSGKPYT